jgi:hypothetical protein
MADDFGRALIPRYRLAESLAGWFLEVQQYDTWWHADGIQTGTELHLVADVASALARLRQERDNEIGNYNQMSVTAGHLVERAEAAEASRDAALKLADAAGHGQQRLLVELESMMKSRDAALQQVLQANRDLTAVENDAEHDVAEAEKERDAALALLRRIESRVPFYAFNEEFVVELKAFLASHAHTRQDENGTR